MDYKNLNKRWLLSCMIQTWNSLFGWMCQCLVGIVVSHKILEYFQVNNDMLWSPISLTIVSVVLMKVYHQLFHNCYKYSNT